MCGAVGGAELLLRCRTIGVFGTCAFDRLMPKHTQMEKKHSPTGFTYFFGGGRVPHACHGIWLAFYLKEQNTETFGISSIHSILPAAGSDRYDVGQVR